MPLPESYKNKTDEECKQIIAAKKEEFGSELAILVHHYQRKELVAFNDYIGDSYALSAKAAANKEVKNIVFCGVHFMAESADILSDESVNVFLSDEQAGCPMADMAQGNHVLKVWQELSQIIDITSVMPIAYMNSTAELKAFVGKNGGVICTSSNADKAFNYGYDKVEKILFFPDEHLGRNTGNKLGLKEDEVILYDPFKPNGGNEIEAIKAAKLILWKGYCHVHQRFTTEMLDALRGEFPEVKIIVHPECPQEVVKAADVSGSTKQILDFVQDQPDGSTIAIGTEQSFVARLQDEYPTKTIMPLTKDVGPYCHNMRGNTLQHLAYTLETLKEGGGTLIKVDQSLVGDAKLSLERMLELK